MKREVEELKKKYIWKQKQIDFTRDDNYFECISSEEYDDKEILLKKYSEKKFNWKKIGV